MNADTNGKTKAQSRTMNRAQRGSGCSFMIAPRIIEASMLDSPPEAQQADGVPVQRARPQLPAEALERGAEERVRDRQRGPAQEVQQAAQRDRAGGSDGSRPPDGVPRRRLERARGVLGVKELQPRVEPELGRDHRQAQVASERRVEIGA